MYKTFDGIHYIWEPVNIEGEIIVKSDNWARWGPKNLPFYKNFPDHLIPDKNLMFINRPKKHEPICKSDPDINKGWKNNEMTYSGLTFTILGNELKINGITVFTSPLGLSKTKTGIWLKSFAYYLIDEPDQLLSFEKMVKDQYIQCDQESVPA
jgi:hypothetical protein